MKKKYRKQYSNSYQSMEAIWNVLRQYSSEERPVTVSEIYDILKRTEDKPPCFSTVEKRLKNVWTYGGFGAYELCCVACMRGPDGKSRFIPYGDLEANSTRDKNNVTRYYYLKSPLPQGAGRLLSDFVRDYPYITCSETNQILDKVDLLIQPKQSRAFRHGDSKPARSAVLLIIDRIDRAIRERKKLLVTVGSYALERRGGRLVPVLHPSEEVELAPYTLVWSGGHYWLVGRAQEPVTLRLDRISGAKLLDEDFTAPKSFDPAAYRADLPLTASGRRTVVRLRCSLEVLEDVAELLGQGAQYSALKADGSFEVIAPAAPEGVKSLALRRPDGVEVLEPKELCQDVLRTLRQGIERYSP